MEKTKLQTITNLFENNEIRSIWNSEEEEYYYSVVDVIAALTNSDYQKSRNYWKWLKGKLHNEGSELVSNTNQLKMKSKDGKYYKTDTLAKNSSDELLKELHQGQMYYYKKIMKQMFPNKEVEAIVYYLHIHRYVTL